MLLKKVNISNYRSIIDAEEVELSNYNVIIGRNNQGKTNVLSAIELAFNTLELYSNVIRDSTVMSRSYYKDRFNFDRDYPVSLKEEKKPEPTTIILEFSLDEQDRKLFYKETGLINNGVLKLSFKYSENNRPAIDILEKFGQGKTRYMKMLREITNFIMEHFDFVYIPAIRTEKESLNIINRLVNKELLSLNKKEKYQEALSVVQEMEEEIINLISEHIKDPINTFLEEVVDTKISRNNSYRRTIFRDNYDFYIDDGNLTELSQKGEGVKSVVTLALLNNLESTSKSRLVAIEEPESHLHPEAIHKIHKTLQEIAMQSSVIITTHNPIFVNRDNIENNFVIEDSKLMKANNIDKIRELLGVRISDNLFFAEYVIIVEGKNDEKVIKHILETNNNKIKEALESRKLIFIPLNGVGKLTALIKVLEPLLINYLIILDDDKAANDSINSAKKEVYLKESQYIKMSRGPKKSSEFEDLLNVEFYKEFVQGYVNFDRLKNRYKKGSWSSRLKQMFNFSGRDWNSDVEYEIKGKISDAIIELNEFNCFNFHGKNIINNIETQVVNMLEKK